MSKTKLIPPDKKQCQAETLEGSFMTLGPRAYVRCKSKPVVIVTEKVAQPDGQRGAMSLCGKCHKEFEKKMGKNYATVRKLGKPKKSKS